MKFEVDCNIDIPRNLAKVENETFWLFGASEYHRLMVPYIPYKTGTTAETVQISGEPMCGIIDFLSPQSHFLWEGKLMVDPNTGSSWAKKDVKKVYTNIPLDFSNQNHPKATDHWNEVANETQLPKLIDAMQDYIDMGGLNLNG